MIRLISSNVILIISLLITFNNTNADSEFITNSTLTPPSIRYIFATLRTVIRQTRSLDVGEPVTKWQLFNECSQGFVQSFLHAVNALGKREDVCLNQFVVFMRHVDGSFALQNAHTHHFLCLNRRLRFTTMATGTSLKCRFYEHMDQSGYTLIESAWSPGTLLGFGKNGHSINTKNRARKRRCFFFSKLESSINLQQTNDCITASRQTKSTRESQPYLVDPTFLNDVFQKSLNRVFA